MNRRKESLTKGVIAGIVIGSAVGMAVKTATQPRRSKFARTAGRALDTMGTVMQNIADMVK
ncbi:MAG: hypothetical protein GX303_02080 [Clostridiales bacterium]|nr:hypothetical protein [Clostridiales bacterium]